MKKAVIANKQAIFIREIDQLLVLLSNGKPCKAVSVNGPGLHRTGSMCTLHATEPSAILQGFHG